MIKQWFDEENYEAVKAFIDRDCDTDASKKFDMN